MKENLVLLPFQSSTWLIEKYLQNQRNYLQNQCWKYDLIKTDGIFKNKKKSFFSSYIESPIFNTNPSNIKLQMLLEGLKFKQLKKIQPI